MATYPIIGSPFQIETVPSANGLWQLNLTARDSFVLDGAGLAAVIAQVSTYLSSSKCVSVLRLAPQGAGVEVRVSLSGCAYPVLTADISSQVSALTTIVQTAADVSV